MNGAEAGGSTDEELVAEFQRDPGGARGRRALDALMERWRGRVLQWSLRMLREREAALDAAQDALVQVYTALPRYESRGRFAAWLFAIVHNRCLTELRRRAPKRAAPEELDAVLADDEGPAVAFENSRAIEQVVAAMDRVLAPQERLALWLRCYEGMGVEDITRVLRIENVSGARGVLQNARRKLREALSDRLGERRG
jgi:RNA polymerase sigma-70 factor, ECF subfamily